MSIHIVVGTLAGSATLSIHKDTGAYCVPVFTALLDPADVLALATKLTAASVPPPPVLKRRVYIRRCGTNRWMVQCPECFPLPGAYQDHPSALADAYRHIAAEHASELAS